MSARPEDIDARLVQAIRYTLGVYVTLDDAAKVRAAIHAAGFVVEQGWQPISTAPRDVDVEVWNAATGAYRSRWTEDEWPMGFWERLGKWYPRPTHWRPLPAGPEVEE